jgi:DoxX-like protein
MTTVSTRPTQGLSKGLRTGLWFAQLALCAVFAGTGIWKLTTPIPTLAAKFAWMGDVPAPFLRATGVIDLMGGLGVLFPTLLRLAPGLTVLAALGCALLQLCAIVFHIARGEAANTPFNVILVVLAAFVVWGRRRAPVAGATG